MELLYKQHVPGETFQPSDFLFVSAQILTSKVVAMIEQYLLPYLLP